MAKKKTKPKKSDLTFEESLAELEAVVDNLEGGELGLDDALEQYEQGVAHLKSCNQRLEQAERRIELLCGFDAQGNPIVEPFDEASSSLDEKAASRSRRRSRPSAGEAGVDEARGLF